MYEAYQKLTDPKEFIKTFDSDQEFEDWCRDGTLDDLKATLKAFENSELYEHCRIILNILKETALAK